MTAFHLKVIALASMIIDHMGAVFPEYFGFEFRIIGRLAFPIFVYLIAEGFRHTKRPEKFLARLAVFAIISEPPFDWAIHGGVEYFPRGVDFLNSTNIFYTLFLGGVAIYAFQKVKEILSPRVGNIVATCAAVLPLFASMAAANALTADYRAYGVAFIFIMYVIKPRGFRLGAMAVLCLWQFEWIIRRIVPYLIAGNFASLPVSNNAIMMMPVTLITVALVAFYNGKRGRDIKWFFYAAYPIHLAIFVIVRGVL